MLYTAAGGDRKTWMLLAQKADNVDGSEICDKKIRRSNFEVQI
jgi:hypothetical protein